MNDQQLAERLTRAAQGLPPAAETAIGEVQRRASARRRHQHLRRSAVGLAIVAGLAVAVPSLTSSGGSPEIAPMTQQPENDSSPQTPLGETDGPGRAGDQGDVTTQGGEAQQQRAPQAGQLDAQVDFDVYAILAPDGWQHVDTGVRTILPEEGAWTWVETRWTPSGGSGGGEDDARLDLRQTDMATLGGEPIPVHGDADRIEIQAGLTAYLITERLPSDIEHHLLEWQQGNTYLELSGQGLTTQELIDAAATAEPTPKN